jgi:uncharacterized protein
MATDHIRYDILAQAALRGVVRTVLADAAKKGLPGENHFKSTFNTTAPGVRLSERIRARYPQDMTIVLQHQFWDLTITDEGFGVGLSFNGIPEHLMVPWSAITDFVDPSVQFALKFAVVGDEKGAPGEAAAPQPSPPTTGANLGETPRPPARHEVPSPPASDDAAATKESPTPDASPPDKPEGGGEVVRLDRFRKK